MSELHEVYGESERLQKRREAVLESARTLDRLTRDFTQGPAEVPMDPQAVNEALQKLAEPDKPAA